MAVILKLRSGAFQLKLPRVILVLLSAVITLTAIAQESRSAQSDQPTQVFQIPETNISFLSGDTWLQGNQKLRLYGIQSCIRGTQYTDRSGVTQDCGTVSLAMLAAIIRDTNPSCSPIAQLSERNPAEKPTILVVCSAHVGNQSLDLGTVLITQGFAFAAFSNDAKPVYMPYLVAEATAKQAKAGLWAYADMPHPNIVLFQAMQIKTQKP